MKITAKAQYPTWDICRFNIFNVLYTLLQILYVYHTYILHSIIQAKETPIIPDTLKLTSNNYWWVDYKDFIMMQFHKMLHFKEWICNIVRVENNYLPS